MWQTTAASNVVEAHKSIIGVHSDNLETTTMRRNSIRSASSPALAVLEHKDEEMDDEQDACFSMPLLVKDGEWLGPSTNNSNDAAAREKRAALLYQIKTENSARSATDVISNTAMPTVVSFSTVATGVPWSPPSSTSSATFSIRHIKKSLYSQPPTSPGPISATRRERRFFDTEAGVLLRTLPFLGVFAASMVAIGVVWTANTLILGLS